MPGEVDAVSDRRGIMKSSVIGESSGCCRITETCSSTVSGKVFETLNCDSTSGDVQGRRFG